MLLDFQGLKTEDMLQIARVLDVVGHVCDVTHGIASQQFDQGIPPKQVCRAF